MEVHEYLVTLGIRPAELTGLKELPGSTKDHLTPLVLLAPWLATTPLSRALDKFEEAYPSRPYLIDVDTYYQVNEKPNEAKDLWTRLAHRPADLEAWWGLLAQYPNSNPCLLMGQQPIERVKEQIDWARANDRTFCVRLNLAEGIGPGIPHWMEELLTDLAEEGASDYSVVYEFGWVKDPLMVAAQAIGLKERFFTSIPPNIPIAISCTSFPTEFSGFDGLRAVPFTNRELVAQVQRATNHPKIICGDWGTTRPRSPGFGHPKNRIDYPTDNFWIIARDDQGDIDFQTAARRIAASEYWDGDLGIWGEQLIAGAAEGHAFAMDTLHKMRAARINIHLHRQAFYGHLPPPQALDEEWSDDDL